MRFTVEIFAKGEWCRLTSVPVRSGPSDRAEAIERARTEANRQLTGWRQHYGDAQLRIAEAPSW
jgi:hypothetical protein